MSARLIGVALIAALVMIAARAVSKRAPSHDDTISLIAATGHQLDYAATATELEGRWVEARRWQALAAPADFPDFARVSEGLARTDVHPPLYFWLLHVLCAIVGASPLAALLLNLILVGATALVIVAVARRLGCPPLAARTGAVIWLAGGASAAVALEVRPYALLALLATSAMWALVRYLERPGCRAAAAVATLTAVGLLAHFHYGIALAAVGGVAAAALIAARRWRALVVLAAAAAVGTAVAILGFPEFAAAIGRLDRQTGGDLDLGYRASRSAAGVLELAMPRTWARALGWWPLLAVAAIAATAFAVRSRRSLLSVNALPAVAGIATVVAVVALYLTGASPRHAMSAKYLAVSAPFLCVAAAQLLSRLRRPHVALVAAALMVLLAVPGTIRSVRDRRGSPSGAALVIGSIARGDVVRVLWAVDPATRVLAARPARLPRDLGEARVTAVALDSDLIERLGERGYRPVVETRSRVGPVVELER